MKLKFCLHCVIAGQIAYMRSQYGVKEVYPWISFSSPDTVNFYFEQYHRNEGFDPKIKLKWSWYELKKL